MAQQTGAKATLSHSILSAMPLYLEIIIKNIPSLFSLKSDLQINAVIAR
jgi:hypothetical protein